MFIKKLLKENLGEYHPEQALIFTETGEIYLTGEKEEAEGFPLIAFMDKEELQAALEKQVALEVERIATPTKCGGYYNAGGYESSC